MIHFLNWVCLLLVQGQVTAKITISLCIISLNLTQHKNNLIKMQSFEWTAAEVCLATTERREK